MHFTRSSHRRCSINRKKALLKNFHGKALGLESFFNKVFRNIHRKTPVLESLFNKVADLIMKCLRTPILNNICEPLLLAWPDWCKCSYLLQCFPILQNIFSRILETIIKYRNIGTNVFKSRQTPMIQRFCEKKLRLKVVRKKAPT